MSISIPHAPDTIKWYHKLSTLPLRAMKGLNLGPLGGDNSISVIIESVLSRKKGQEVDYPLSKTEQFFVDQLAKSEVPAEMVEYRELSFQAEKELLTRYQQERLGIIWVGAGVFTLEHPLLAQSKKEDWHFWTDASQKVVNSARKAFQELQERNLSEAPALPQNLTLPQDIGHLNELIRFLGQQVDRIIIMGYGVTYALTAEENYNWLSKISLDSGLPLHFVFNSPGQKTPFLPGVMAAFHHQRMVYYTTEAVEKLFTKAIPGSKVSWQIDRADTNSKVWGTWIIDGPAPA